MAQKQGQFRTLEMGIYPGSYPHSNPSDAIAVFRTVRRILRVQNLTDCCETFALRPSILTSTNGCNSGGVNDQAVTLNSVSNITITGNTVHDSQICIFGNMAIR